MVTTIQRNGHAATCTCGQHETESETLYETNRRSPAYVRWLQASLNRVGSAGLAVDGDFGPKTRAAVIAFQRSRNLAPDGIVGSRTEAALIVAGAIAPPGRTTPGPSPAPKPVDRTARPCPKPAQAAMDRCTQPGSQICPAVPDMICVYDISGIPFEYPTAIRRDPASGLRVVSARQSTRKQQFTPVVRDALARVVADLRRFQLPVEAILTYGSYYCRCISNTNTLSNHSFGDAIDIAGIRFAVSSGLANSPRETIVHNFADPAQRARLRRIDACLRLSFATVIDYSFNKAHQDHFHCDTNRGRGRRPRGSSTMVFTQEALNHVLGTNIPQTGKFDAATQRALMQFSGVTAAGLKDDRILNQILDGLFTRVAAGP